MLILISFNFVNMDLFVQASAVKNLRWHSCGSLGMYHIHFAGVCRVWNKMDLETTIIYS